jgi:hypothetical protein
VCVCVCVYVCVCVCVYTQQPFLAALPDEVAVSKVLAGMAEDHSGRSGTRLSHYMHPFS